MPAQLRHSNATALNFVIKQSAARLDAQQRMRHILATHTHRHTHTHTPSHAQQTHTHARRHPRIRRHPHARTHARAREQSRAREQPATAARSSSAHAQAVAHAVGTAARGTHGRWALPVGVAPCCCSELRLFWWFCVATNCAAFATRRSQRGSLEYSGEGGRKSQCRCKYRTGTRLGYSAMLKDCVVLGGTERWEVPTGAGGPRVRRVPFGYVGYSEHP